MRAIKLMEPQLRNSVQMPSSKMPSEMEVAPRYTLLTLFTLFNVNNTVQTAFHYLNRSMPLYIRLERYRVSEQKGFG